MKKTRRHGFELVIEMVLLIFIMATAILFLIYSTLLSSHSLTYTEEYGKSDTTLYVILNNNEQTKKTTLPFKDILATAIGEGKTNIDTTLTIDYNGKTETVNLKTILESNLQALGIEEYNFYVMRGPSKIMVLKTSGFDKNYKNVTAETEYISVPYSDPKVASVILFIAKKKYDNDVSGCPGELNLKCYPRLTCTQYGGTCEDEKYACGSMECCCRDAEI